MQTVIDKLKKFNLKIKNCNGYNYNRIFMNKSSVLN